MGADNEWSTCMANEHCILLLWRWLAGYLILNNPLCLSVSEQEQRLYSPPPGSERRHNGARGDITTHLNIYFSAYY